MYVVQCTCACTFYMLLFYHQIHLMSGSYFTFYSSQISIVRCCLFCDLKSIVSTWASILCHDCWQILNLSYSSVKSPMHTQTQHEHFACNANKCTPGQYCVCATLYICMYSQVFIVCRILMLIYHDPHESSNKFIKHQR